MFLKKIDLEAELTRTIEALRSVIDCRLDKDEDYFRGYLSALDAIEMNMKLRKI